MLKVARAGAAVLAMTIVAAGCGSSSGGAPDVAGGPASDQATLFKAANLTKVLDKVKGKLGGAAATVVKIEPRDVKVIAQGTTVTVDVKGKSLVVKLPSTPGPTTFDIAIVSPATVEKVVSKVESKAKLKQSDIGYVAISADPISNKPSINVYPRSSTTHYSADIKGGHVKSYGGTSSGAGSGGGASGGKVPKTGGSGGASSGAGAGSAQSTADCIQKAGTDPAKIKACTGG